MVEFDVESHLDAVERSVTWLERDGMDASEVTLARDYATTVEDLWDAVTNQERIPRWFAPVSGELRLGGSYQVEGNAGGKITACEQNSHFSLDWVFSGWTSWVDVSVSDAGPGRARLSLTHTAHLSDFWDTYGPGAAGVGWEMGFVGLGLYLADPDWPKPDIADFATSPDGKAFITGSSEGWGRAAVAAGTDPEAANAAVARTTAFYTGESDESA